MTDFPAEHAPTPTVDQAVAEGGAYEVLKKRLETQGERLRQTAETLNQERLAEFGDSRMALAGRFRIRSENNCVGRDIVQVGDLLLFGFNVFIGLKTATTLHDVFGLYRLVDTDQGHDVEPVDFAGTFLSEPTFVRDFDELYAYYKHARLLQLVVREGKLLAAFQIGERSTDMRVFRWSIAASGEVSYIDARGERDIALPAPFDFEWRRAGREMEVSGRFPHLNILDTLFVDTTGGDLTIKIENNTETGKGIFAEPVEDTTQSIDDARIEFAHVGSLILLKVLPYRESEWRGLVYNTLTRKVTRIDAIVQACVQLPEDHGIIFPGGSYLQNGEYKAFDATMRGMQFKRAIRSPNGEDVLYVFYERESGLAALFVYNLIQRGLQNPVFAHGYARLPDGRMVLFHAENNEPTRVHQMQLWLTPFASDEYAAATPPGNSFMGRLGNAELVRGISNLYDLARAIDAPEVSAQRYLLLTEQTRRLFDQHHWIDDTHCHGLSSLLHEISATGESVLDEFEKVESIRAQSDAAMSEAHAEQRRLLGRLQPDSWSRVEEFVEALNAITTQRGHLLTIREYRYIDTAAIDRMAGELREAHARIGTATGEFLAGDKALAPLNDRLQQLDAAAQKADTARLLGEEVQAMNAMSTDLNMLSELMASLKVDDANQRARVVEAISGLYARLNQARARAEQKHRTLGASEAVAQFGAQFALFGQSIASALGMANSPERADEQLSRLMVQLEELEGQFGEHEQFLGDILAKREELLETFETHKQALLDERQRKAQSVLDAANRILDGLAKRTERFDAPDALNAFFATDPLVLKLRELSERLRELKDPVKADDVEARLKSTRDQAVRVLRDRNDLFEDGGNVIRMGRHRFNVNPQPLDLTVLPRGEHLAVHLTGTDYMQPLEDDALDALRPFWHVTLDSESPEVYRGEYLAAEIMAAARAGRDGLDDERLLQAAAAPDELAALVREFAAPRYREGYEKGIHDHDAARILGALLPLERGAGTLIHPPLARALGALFWHHIGGGQQLWRERIVNAAAMRRLFGRDDGFNEAIDQLAGEIAAFLDDHGIEHQTGSTRQSAGWLADELADGETHLGFSRQSEQLARALTARLDNAGSLAAFRQSLATLENPGERWRLMLHWLNALAAQDEHATLARFAPEAAALKLIGESVPHRIHDAALEAEIDGLLGEHPRIGEGRLRLSIDEFRQRLGHHREAFVPAFHRYQKLRQQVIADQRERLRLSEYQARPLTSFVRNRLINDIYLPIIGDNLAKQMGTAGESKRSDLMGLLMLISPPGYGKTTLMEYVANRLGLVFMKINGPALGHEVRSLDPAQAPDATSRRELEKLNLALEMGNNVMLYVDDIQHTHPEFLQKFISLTDGTRRIEGVWRGRTRTYDMRGRKFAVVMAGNPYTESGEVFRIPDMLANRADIYNLGDVLDGMEDAFLSSYVENSLTSNPVLAPLATRDLKDLHVLVDKALGKEVSTSTLSHAYGAAEINDITATLEKLIAVRQVIYRVNQQYIASAAQADQYRTEPPFKLQGSYRNMNKLAEKIAPVMNDAELQQLISDHYLGESQLLTTGAEENLLKLGELRGTLDAGETARWAQIKADFLRNKAMGADDADIGGRVVAQLADIAGGLQTLKPTSPVQTEAAPWAELLASLHAIGQRGASDEARLADLPDALARRIDPLLSSVADAQTRQTQLNESLLRLADALREGLLRPPTAARPGKPAPRAKNPALEKLDRELGKVNFQRHRPADKPDPA
ncbi:AAA family ATPase [Lysobacter pythonis]|uniref:AAA family ATPase n=1 Tax=Solilutibacter pythonis TaxID=2483112 RepID=A0A3M2HY98_9GAMM|nr:DNA repair ATPase [Lysobacter pythonis]RMH91147.1 AAA family ATPase [Lysobacter pythonis]